MIGLILLAGDILTVFVFFFAGAIWVTFEHDRIVILDCIEKIKATKAKIKSAKERKSKCPA
jgi:hypothetical protein